MAAKAIFGTSIFIYVCLLSCGIIQAQEKDIAKVDSYLEKAKETDDPVKKRDLYNKAAQVIMSARLDKSEYIKLGDASLEDGNTTDAARYYMRCEKEDKNAGYIKVGKKLIEQAFDDPKMEDRTMRKAISYFSKAKADAEGYEAVGDVYYDLGKSSYMTAADYYARGKIFPKIDKIAGEYIAENKPRLAADVYLKMNDPESFKKAGDLYYNMGAYNDAFTAYEKGGITEGIKKYADQLYTNGDKADADALYFRIAEMLVTKEDKPGLEKLAQSAEERGNYTMAASFYEKAGAATKASTATAYADLYTFDTEAAKTGFEAVGYVDMAKAITTNKKYLDELKSISQYFQGLINYQPFVSYTTDSASNEKIPNKAELTDFTNYYENAAATIVDKCHEVSYNVLKISDPTLKKAMMHRFRQYRAIGKILDSNFNTKLTKSQVSASDVIL